MATTYLTPSLFMKEAMLLVEHSKQSGLYSVHLPLHKWLDLCLDEYSSDILWPRIVKKSRELPKPPTNRAHWETVTGAVTTTNDGIFIEVSKAA